MNTNSTVKQEFERAIREKRQPNCPYCQKPLVVEQVQTDYLRWDWDEEQHCYTKADSDGRSDDPYCANCREEDADFLSFSSTAYELCERLGLDY